MEKEGLKRSLALLDARGVTIDSIVTDRHPQIQKFLRDNNITQFYDVWHMEKGTLTQRNIRNLLIAGTPFCLQNKIQEVFCTYFGA